MVQTQSLPNWLVKRAGLSPARIALTFKERSYTFLEMHTEAEKWAAIFYQKGIRKGATVGLLLGNHPDSVFIIHSLFYIGARVLLLNSRLTENELEFQLDDSEAVYLISEKKFGGKIGFAARNKRIKTIIKEEDTDAVSTRAQIQTEFNQDEIASIMYTSGTTGHPKGVLQSFGNHWWSAIGSMLNLGMNEDDTWLCAVPIFHISGLSILMRSVIYGMRVVLHDSFDEDKINKDIMHGGVSIISVVTSMLNRLLINLGEQNYPSSFRCMLLGGGPAPKFLLEQCKERNIPVFQTYGMTETSSQIVTLSPEYSIEKLGSAGKPLFPSQLYIEKEGMHAGPNVAGEIVVKGPNVVKGYYKREEQTNRSFQNEWFYTGDIGYLDEDGFLFVLDRRSDLIISGGENIYPAEIEAVLTRHPLVFEAGVAGFPDKKWGQVPYAFVVLLQGAAQNESEMIRFCQSHLASYKLPKKVIFVHELPRNSSGKLVRRDLHKFI